MNEFYKNVADKKKKKTNMGFHTDQEFIQNEMKT